MAPCLELCLKMSSKGEELVFPESGSVLLDYFNMGRGFAQRGDHFDSFRIYFIGAKNK